MDQIEEHYYTLNKSFLKVLGLWHHDNSWLVLLRRMLIIVITTTYIAMQLSVFITTKYNMTLFIRVTSLACPFTVMILKYCVFIFKSKTIKNLHNLIQEDWKILRNKVESEIIQKYAHIGQYCTVFIFFYINFVFFAVLLIQLLPIILDVILPLDEPRPRNLIFVVEYFIFHDKYFYTTILHEFVFLTLCASIMFATGTQLLVFVCHSFGMFKVASHRIKHTIEDNIFYIPNPEKERIICERIMHAVIAHRRAIEFSDIIVSSFNVQYCVILILGVISLSINLFGLVEATVSKNMDNMAMCFLSAMGHLIYLFVATFAGQKISDYNSDFFKVAYDTTWYLTSVKSQKLILFLLQKNFKDYYFTLGLIFVAKMESCAIVINAALSYVAVMYSCAY